MIKHHLTDCVNAATAHYTMKSEDTERVMMRAVNAAKSFLATEPSMDVVIGVEGRMRLMQSGWAPRPRETAEVWSSEDGRLLAIAKDGRCCVLPNIAVQEDWSAQKPVYSVKFADGDFVQNRDGIGTFYTDCEFEATRIANSMTAHGAKVQVVEGAWRDETVKAISNGKQWTVLDTALKAYGFVSP